MNPFKRGNTWTFVYYTKESDGHFKQHWKGGYTTKTEAEKELRKYKAMVELGQAISPQKITISDYLDEWFGIHQKTLQPSTVNGYLNNIEKHIKPVIGKKKLKDLKPSDVQKLYIVLEEKGLSACSIKYVHNVLNTAMKAAVYDKLIGDNPCERVKTPKIKKYHPVLLSIEQIAKLFQYLEDTKYETEIKLACLHGLRRGEVLGIKECDVDFQKHTLSIHQQVTNIRLKTQDKTECSYYGIKSLKTEKSNRKLELSAESERLIRRRMAWNAYQRKALGDIYNDNGLLCCKEDGSILSPQTLTDGFKAALKACDLPNMRFHDLRHSYATLCIDLNVPIKVISEALGHSSTAVTAEVYADSISAKKELAEKISKAIKDAGNNYETTNDNR